MNRRPPQHRLPAPLCVASCLAIWLRSHVLVQIVQIVIGRWDILLSAIAHRRRLLILGRSSMADI